jgi:hypothetical protein
MLRLINFVDSEGSCRRTSSDMMNLVLDEEVDEGYQGRKEGASEYLSKSDRGRVLWAQGKAAQGPR